MTARFDGTYSYTNAYKQVIVMKKFDYGTPCQKIWSPEEIAAMRQKVEAQKQAVKDRVLQSNQKEADSGDVYGLLRMGERYRDGDDVPKDLDKAREYLSKAANAGSETASNELSQLN
jgi:TPR repeat protein